MKGWLSLIPLLTTCAVASVSLLNSKANITYDGFSRNGVDIFLNIPYGLDTSGENRFKPPRPYVAKAGTTIDTRTDPPACPQPLGAGLSPPLSLTNVTNISEDCLNLAIARPGGFWSGQTTEITTAPDGLILESVANGLPVIHVAMNYRLGFFGFAQSDALKVEGSENAGLRDQRLAIEWVRGNIEHFGGDPSRITIFGQSSGGLAVGMQIMAYGASQPVPFQQAICESQALEPGITGNFTMDAMKLLADAVGCNTTSLQSAETVNCLRKLDTDTLLNASIATYQSDTNHNVGDIWLPVVDGDFLPAAPSQLIYEGRFANVTAMIGWTENDVTFFTPTDIKTEADTFNFVAGYLPDMQNSSIDDLLMLYPISDFAANPSAHLSTQFYRSARIFRDILMTCMPIWYGEALSKAHNTVYYYDFNQTLLDAILASQGDPGFGPVHTSEFAYIFGNLSHYNVNGYPFHPTTSDYSLRDRASRSWSTFASVGQPSLTSRNTLKGWTPSFSVNNETDIYVVGGPTGGYLSSVDGPRAAAALAAEKLGQRCAFLNSPAIIKQMRF